MTTSILVKDLKTIKHITNKYAVLFMYFFKINSSNVSTKIVITREMYLVSDLKTNLLIDNDILESGKIDVFNSMKSALINNCEIISFITTRIEFKSQTKLVHAINTLTIFLKFEYLILVHRLISFFDRDFLFESVDTNFAIYVHVINFQTLFILIRMDHD